MVEKILRPDAVPADTVQVEYQEKVQSMTHTSPINTHDDIARPTTNACETGIKGSVMTTWSGHVVCLPHRHEL